MNKIYLYLPYVVIFDITAYFFFHHYNPNNATTLLIPVLGILCSYLYYNLQDSIENFSKNFSHKVFAEKRLDFINKYQIPSVIIYRVKKNYDCSNEDIRLSQNELTELFKNQLNSIITNNKSTQTLKSPLSYEIWREFSLSGAPYQKFCENAFGNYFPFDKSHIDDANKSLSKVEPHLKAYSLA